MTYLKSVFLLFPANGFWWTFPAKGKTTTIKFLFRNLSMSFHNLVLYCHASGIRCTAYGKATECKLQPSDKKRHRYYFLNTFPESLMMFFICCRRIKGKNFMTKWKESGSNHLQLKIMWIHIVSLNCLTVQTSKYFQCSETHCFRWRMF